MCKYCDINSNECEIFQEGLTYEYYLNVATFEYDEYEGDYIYKKVYGIAYCPYCGRKL